MASVCKQVSRTAILNVIPYNPVAGLLYKTPSQNAQRAFRQILEQGGVNVHFRHRKGDAIDAACGMLDQGIDIQEVGPMIEPPEGKLIGPAAIRIIQRTRLAACIG